MPLAVKGINIFTDREKNLAEAEKTLSEAHAVRVDADAKARLEDALNAPPFPGFTTLAGRMGISATAAWAHARSLEKKGYLVRQMRVGTTNKFDMHPLFAALEKQQAYERGKREGRAAKKAGRRAVGV